MREVGRNLIEVHAGIDADDVAAALAGDVPHGRDPTVARGERGRGPDVHALAVDVEPGQRHVVLPAGQARQPPVRGVDDRQGGAVAHAPHGALGAGGHQLAVLAEQSAVGSEIQGGVVDRGAVRFAFVHPDHQVRAGLASGGGEGVGDRAGHNDGLVDQQRVPIAVAVPDRHGVDPDRIAGDEHLGEHHDPGPFGGGLMQQLDRLVHTGLLIHQDVSRLHRGDLHCCHRWSPIGWLK